MRAGRVVIWTFTILISGLATLTVVVATLTWESSGSAPRGERLAEMQRSEHWRDGKFRNNLSRVDGNIFRAFAEFFFGGGKARKPKAPLPIDPRQESDYATRPSSGLRLTWLGHSTTLVEIGQATILIDPIFSERASPVSFAGPRRFHIPPLELEALPTLDAVVISHDHYDHLDEGTIKRLLGGEHLFITPLGVGAHLAGWGVEERRIVELDWWESQRVLDVDVTCTPSRHFSGRSPFFHDQYRTLWAGFAFASKTRRVFYSGDTALHPEFRDIGERLGPFDVTLMETGAYNQMWADVHLGPEQAVIAHQLVRGRVMIPVHWGSFDLALHSWTEPVERVIAAAERVGVTCHVMMPGGRYDVADLPRVSRWWPETPWQSGEQAPVWSSSVAPLLDNSTLKTP